MKNDKENHPDVHLNLNVRGLHTSATLAINERCRLMREEGRHIYRLGLGQSPFPVPESVVEKLRTNAHEKDYLPVKGLPALRRRSPSYYERRQGIDRSAEDVLVGPGSKELMFILQLVYYGDLVIPTPSWVSYAPQAHIIGRHIRWVPTTAEEGWPSAAERARCGLPRGPGTPAARGPQLSREPHRADLHQGGASRSWRRWRAGIA